jgi:triosephosphate isomerase
LTIIQNASQVLRRRQSQDASPRSACALPILTDPRNGSADSVKKIVQVLNNATLDPNVQVVVAPPSIYLIITRESLRKDVEVAAQNVYDKAEGAYTGEIAVSQLLDTGITWTILGHSERRQLLGESDAVSTISLSQSKD